ncbi:uncharacterized protein CANTADRAFT_26291 [Suhomyces tanzawaensis NRRL Y-17324]|uniref:Uncharacterized protein n=1 Tax=Suhomyces tanzawaensis NRRL Y-17324 TaxID=984487 RepID=A0A1E4SIK0_9ASCO|nr:uncharacterized protein CANTADRAFT_26291 [Suhomyces tanzawaensis NRRL Y-17324]ODV79331.1 hypothetical protein CANTADRAFT_26291 [Suhomyces tanzawaensis NRRL Y-17324]
MLHKLTHSRSSVAHWLGGDPFKIGAGMSTQLLSGKVFWLLVKIVEESSIGAKSR